MNPRYKRWSNTWQSGGVQDSILGSAFPTGQCDRMDDEKPRPHTVTLNGDLYDLSVSDIDERIDELKIEIARLQDERARKAGSVAAADAFFKPRG